MKRNILSKLTFVMLFAFAVAMNLKIGRVTAAETYDGICICTYINPDSSSITQRYPCGSGGAAFCDNVCNNNKPSADVEVEAEGTCTLTGCDDGTYIWGGVCTPCPAGYKCPNGVKSICPAGTISSEGATTCTPCSDGYFQNEAGKSTCKFCPIGYTLESTSSCYIKCPAGSHVDTINGECVPCTTGVTTQETTVMAGNTSTCTQCTGGKVANEFHTACVSSGGGESSTEFTITLNANGGVIPTTTGWTNGTDNKTSTKTFTSNSTLGTLPEVTKEGTTFKEWNTKQDGTGTKYTSTSTVSSALTLYAIWTDGSSDNDGQGGPDEDSLKITFNCNGGTGTMSPLPVEWGQTVTLPENNCTRENFTFTGWNTSANGEGTAYENKATINYTLREGMELFAQWTPMSNTYNVLYNANGGNGTMDPTAATYGKEGTLRKNTFTYKNHTFAGWQAYYRDSSGSVVPLTDANGKKVTFKDGDKFTNLHGPSYEEVTLYAQWKVVNPKTGIVKPTLILFAVLVISALGYYFSKKENKSFE